MEASVARPLACGYCSREAGSITAAQRFALAPGFLQARSLFDVHEDLDLADCTARSLAVLAEASTAATSAAAAPATASATTFTAEPTGASEEGPPQSPGGSGLAAARALSAGDGGSAVEPPAEEAAAATGTADE